MDWREDFDKKFPLYPDFGEKGDKYMTSLRMDIKSFIENLLEQEKKRVEDESIALSPPEYIREPMMVSAFNDGVRAVLSIINKK